MQPFWPVTYGDIDVGQCARQALQNSPKGDDVLSSHVCVLPSAALYEHRLCQTDRCFSHLHLLHFFSALLTLVWLNRSYH